MTKYTSIEAEFAKARSIPCDIEQHMDTLLRLAMECNHVVEAGVRYVVSTWAFILGCACRGGVVHSYCWNTLPEIERAKKICADSGVQWNFHEGDWLKATIPETELLFIDTNHYYWQLKEELHLHADKSSKYIVLHDTTTFGYKSQDGTEPGLWRAVEELVAHGKWEVSERLHNNNGLTILKKK